MVLKYSKKHQQIRRRLKLKVSIMQKYLFIIYLKCNTIKIYNKTKLRKYSMIKIKGSIISVVGKTTVEIIERFEYIQKVP